MIGQSVGAYTNATHGMTLSAVSMAYYRHIMPRRVLRNLRALPAMCGRWKSRADKTDEKNWPKRDWSAMEDVDEGTWALFCI